MILRRLLHLAPRTPRGASRSVLGRGLGARAEREADPRIGIERRFNRVFRLEREDELVALLLRDIQPRPTDAEAIRTANLGGVA